MAEMAENNPVETVKIWFDLDSGTFGTVDSLRIVELEESDIEVFEQLSDANRILVVQNMIISDNLAANGSPYTRPRVIKP
jgi:hypothetical protein